MLLLSLVAAGISTDPSAARLAYLDFGRSSTTGTADGMTYNDVEVDPRSSGVIEEVSLIMNGAATTTGPAPLLDTGNGPTGWGFEIDSLTTAGTIDNNGSEWGGPYPASLGSIETSALRSMFYCNRNKKVRFTLSGLDDNATYNIRFYAAHDQVGTTTNSIIDFIPITGVGDDFVTEQINSYVNTADVLEWDGISSDGGLIVFDAQCRREAWFNFMSIEEISSGSGIRLAITPSAATAGNYDFEWNSQIGMLYDLVSATDLSTAPDTWPVWDGWADLAATPPTNTLGDIPGGGDPRRFFAVVEKDAPPIFFMDFEADNGGFTFASSTGTDWEWGTPDTGGFGGILTSGNGGSANCWATNLGDAGGSSDVGYYTNPTTTTLRSPVIDLTAVAGAEISFAEAVDFDGSDTAELYVIDDATNTEIGPALHSASDGDTSALNWATVGPIALPADALGKRVRFEWRFDGQADQFSGWYIDDVSVRQAAAP